MGIQPPSTESINTIDAAWSRMARLSDEIADLETRLALIERGDVSATADDERQIRAARRRKILDLQRVEARKGELAREERRAKAISRDEALLRIIKSAYPDVFAAAVATLERGVAP